MWLYLREHTPLFHDRLRLFHVAPERDLGARLARLPNLRYASGDLESSLAQARLDLERLPFRDRSFDAILCSHVLEHVADARRALSELHRVLAPGGWALLQSPVDAARAATVEDPAIRTPADRQRVYGQRDHARIFGRDYPEWLHAAGFEVTVERFAAALPEAVIARFGLDPDEDVHHCVRPARPRAGSGG